MHYSFPRGSDSSRAKLPGAQSPDRPLPRQTPPTATPTVGGASRRRSSPSLKVSALSATSASRPNGRKASGRGGGTGSDVRPHPPFCPAPERVKCVSCGEFADGFGRDLSRTEADGEPRRPFSDFSLALSLGRLTQLPAGECLALRDRYRSAREGPGMLCLIFFFFFAEGRRRPPSAV